MALVGALAAVLRFGELARLPLSAAEAEAALGSWQFWSSAPLTAPVAGPAYFAFTNLIMFLGVGGDVAARLVPAVFGLLTVLLPWSARGQARPAAFLVAGLFLAVSPMLVAVSRAAGGDAIALFALLLLVVAWPAMRAGGRRPAVAAGTALGLGLTSSPLFYTGLAALLPAALVAQAVRLADFRNPDRLRRGRLRVFGLSAAATFVVVASCLFLYPAGVGAALRILPAWVEQFGLASDEAGRAASLLSPLLALLRYDPAVAVLGLPASVWAIRRGVQRGVFLSLWVGFLLPVVLLQASTVTNAAAVLLPGYLLVGMLAAATEASAGRAPGGWRATMAAAGGLVGLGALFLVAVGRFARIGLLSGENAPLISLATLAFGLAGLAVVAAMTWESPAARRGVFLGAALLLLFWQWGAASQLSRLGANDPRERWVAAGTDDDAPVMLELLLRASRQAANSDRDLAVFSLVDSPVLRWYLREFDNYGAGPALPLDDPPDVIITPVDVLPELPADYIGADFGLERRETPVAGSSTPEEALKWWLFRESNAAVDEQRVVVWIRSALAAGE
jgi:predicted membrane-bound mannosyltransferase